MDEVALKVGTDVNAPGLTRSHLELLRTALGARYDDVALVVSELVTNSVRHSGVDSGKGAIDINVRVEDELIRVEVVDDGPGFSMADARGDGMGLAIVEKLANEWGMGERQKKFVVWAELSTVPLA